MYLVTQKAVQYSCLCVQPDTKFLVAKPKEGLLPKNRGESSLALSLSSGKRKQGRV